MFDIKILYKTGHLKMDFKAGDKVVYIRIKKYRSLYGAGLVKDYKYNITNVTGCGY